MQILNFNRPGNQNHKPGNNFYVKILWILLAVAVVFEFTNFIDVRPTLHKKHDLVMLKHKVKLKDDIVLQNLNQQQVNLKQYLGKKYTVLAFWATWCGYCAKELPHMDKVSLALKEQGINSLAVARGDDTVEKVNQFLLEHDIKNLDVAIPVTNELHKSLSVQYYPFYVLVDAEGYVIGKMRPKWEDEDVVQLFASLAPSP